MRAAPGRCSTAVLDPDFRRRATPAHAGASLSLSALDFTQPLTQELLERSFGNGLLRREPDGSLREVETGEGTAGCVNRLGAERKDAQVVLARPEASSGRVLYLNAGIP